MAYEAVIRSALYSGDKNYRRRAIKSIIFIERETSDGFESKPIAIPDEISLGLKDKDAVMRRLWTIYSIGKLRHTREQIEAGLTDRSRLVKETWVKMNLPLEEEQVVSLIHDKHASVRALAVSWHVEKMMFDTTYDMFHQGIRDPSAMVRQAWSKNDDVSPEPEDILLGITDKELGVRNVWSTKVFSVLPEHIDIGIRDPEASIRQNWATRPDFRANIEQFSYAILDEDHGVRWNWARRYDCSPTSEQYQAGVNDPSPSVAVAWIGREDFIPTEEQILNGFENSHPLVRSMWVEKASVEFVQKYANRILLGPCNYMKSVLARKSAISLDYDQIDIIDNLPYLKAIMCPYVQIGAHWDIESREHAIRQLLANAKQEIAPSTKRMARTI